MWLHTTALLSPSSEATGSSGRPRLSGNTARAETGRARRVQVCSLARPAQDLSVVRDGECAAAYPGELVLFSVWWP